MESENKELAEVETKSKTTVSLKCYSDETEDAAMARGLIAPQYQAASTIQAWKWKTAKIDINALSDELSLQTDELKKGNMHRAEAMLLAQAHTLDEMFNVLALRAAGKRSDIKTLEPLLRMALKAQNQCRMTLETLSNIKNPPVVYAKQANIAHGPQQVNNGTLATHAAENQNQQNELLTVNHGETLDSIRTGQTIGSDTALAALE